MVTLRRWPYCPNKNVFNERLNCPYDSPGCRKSGGRLFHSCGAGAANVLSPKVLWVRPTASVRVSAEAERSRLALASVTSRQSSAKKLGMCPDSDRWTSVTILKSTRCRTGSQCNWRASSCMAESRKRNIILWKKQRYSRTDFLSNFQASE